jgi:hypothetical protein
MFDREALDERPGAVPEIRADGDSVIYYLDVSSEGARLVIRCEPTGAVRASIAMARDPQKPT